MDAIRRKCCTLISPSQLVEIREYMAVLAKRPFKVSSFQYVSAKQKSFLENAHDIVAALVAQIEHQQQVIADLECKAKL
jgi:hypothetical protein